jgi:hypothetical protein
MVIEKLDEEEAPERVVLCFHLLFFGASLRKSPNPIKIRVWDLP